jgi:hypothetical protein
MIGVTLFGLLFTPVFYVLIRRMAGGDRQTQPQTQHSEQGVVHE